MSHLVYLNGAFIPAEQASLSLYDHGLLYGDGVFEGLRAYDGLLFMYERHLERLYRSAKYLRLPLPGRDELTQATVELLRRNSFRDAYVRVIVTRGPGPLGPDPRPCRTPTVAILAEPLPPALGHDAIARGVSAAIVPTRRDAVDATTHQVKSLNYANSVTALLEAEAFGADVPIMLDARGFVAESAICNLFAVVRGALTTPSEASGVLRGVTRDVVIDLAGGDGWQVSERDLTPYELLTAEEVFLTGTHAELVPVIAINGLPVGSGQVGPVFTRLRELFLKATRDPARGLRIDSGPGQGSSPCGDGPTGKDLSTESFIS